MTDETNQKRGGVRWRQFAVEDPEDAVEELAVAPGGLVKLTVNLVPTVYTALVESAKAAGDTRTDTVNRALHLYEVISRFQAQGWDILAHRHRRRNKLWALLPHRNCQTKKLKSNSSHPRCRVHLPVRHLRVTGPRARRTVPCAEGNRAASQAAQPLGRRRTKSCGAHAPQRRTRPSISLPHLAQWEKEPRVGTAKSHGTRKVPHPLHESPHAWSGDRI